MKRHFSKVVKMRKDLEEINIQQEATVLSLKKKHQVVPEVNLHPFRKLGWMFEEIYFRTPSLRCRSKLTSLES